MTREEIQDDLGWFIHAADEDLAADTLVAMLSDFKTAELEKGGDPLAHLIDHEGVRQLLIAMMVRLGWVEYGVSPRFAWITPRGEEVLKALETHGEAAFEGEWQ